MTESDQKWLAGMLEHLPELTRGRGAGLCRHHHRGVRESRDPPAASHAAESRRRAAPGRLLSRFRVLARWPAGTQVRRCALVSASGVGAPGSLSDRARSGRVHGSCGLVVTVLGPDDRHVRWQVKVGKKGTDISAPLDGPAN